jgi:hypothetical protein
MSQPNHPSTALSQVSSNTVQIVDDNGRFFGTGFFIRKGTV